MHHPFHAEIGVADDGAVTVAFAGELDLAVVDQVRDVLVAAGSGQRVVRVDLAGVTFFDSSATALFVRYGRDLAAGGGRLQIGGRSYIVDRVLEISGLIRSNDCFDILG